MVEETTTDQMIGKTTTDIVIGETIIDKIIEGTITEIDQIMEGTMKRYIEIEVKVGENSRNYHRENSRERHE